MSDDRADGDVKYLRVQGITLYESMGCTKYVAIIYTLPYHHLMSLPLLPRHMDNTFPLPIIFHGIKVDQYVQSRVF